MDGWSLNLLGVPFYNITFDRERFDLLAEGELVEGASWDYDYIATERSFGEVWSAQGTMTVQGTESITVSAGTFDALVITNDYILADLLAVGPGMGASLFAREGRITSYLVERLGLVYSEDIDIFGFSYETRELRSYSGFYP